MWKKLIYLTLFVFAISLAPVEAADPSLQLHLEFEGNADDSSNYARHGTTSGNIEWVPGVIGQAIAKSANTEYVTIIGYKGILGTGAFSVSVWVQTTSGNNGCIVAWGAHHSGNNDHYLEFRVNNGRLRIDHGGGNLQGNTVMNDVEWHHVALTRQAGSSLQHPGVKIWLDAVDDTRTTTGDGGTTDITADFDVRIGLRHSAVSRSLNGSYDDLRMYDRELSYEEIRMLAGQFDPKLVSPADESVLTSPSTLLTWESGVFPADVDGHNVYLSTSWEDVNSLAAGAFQAATSNLFHFASALDTAETYYWRVVDVNGPSSWASEIWSFVVPAVTSWAPFPADGAQFISLDVTLEWKLGLGGALGAVYFGTSFDDVNDATGAPPQPGLTFTPAGPLATETTYYWRADTILGDMTVVKSPVWSFTTRGTKPILDPNLVAYWKMDDLPSGVIVIDDSGYDHYGRLYNGASYVAGYADQAVELDGEDDYVGMDGYKGVLGTHAFSIACWIKTVDPLVNANNQSNIVNWGSSPSGQRIEFRIEGTRLRVSTGNGNVQGDTIVNDGQWHHVAMTVIENATMSSSDMRVYVDGRDDTQSSSDPDGFNLSSGEDVAIGQRITDGDRFFEGMVDEVRIYDRVLSLGDVQNIMDPGKAYAPTPMDGSIDVPLGDKLVWNAGTDETTGNPYTTHNVYFSENFEDVNSGTVPTEVITGGVTEYVTAARDNYKYYYWRIDGVDSGGTPYRGFIWSFKSIYDAAQIVDPNLLAWYKFDGDATDSSGYGRDMVENGEPAYGPGFEDQAIHLDGVDDSAVFSFPVTTMPAYTIAMWVKVPSLGQDEFSSAFSSHTPNSSGFQLDVDGENPGSYRHHDGFDQLIGPASTGWVHLTVACDGARTSMFYNGVFVDSNSPSNLLFNKYAVGVNRNDNDNMFEGAIDELRIYDRELSDPEIMSIMRIDAARAWNPNPGNGASGVDREPALSWTPGDYAPMTSGHYVYFGADDPGNLALVDGQPQTPNDYSPGVLDLERTYYWAVDEVNAAAGGVDPGKIWEFTVANYLVIDDMETYNDSPFTSGVFNTWTEGIGDADCANGNGTGAALTTSTSVVSGGAKSMKYLYDNDGTVESGCGAPFNRAFYSKASVLVTDLPTGIGSDWRAGGAKALSLQFQGEPNNTTESMWIELEDNSGNKAKVTYGTYAGEEALDINDGAWHEWTIDLADFTDVNAADVKSIAIGIGVEGAGSPGGYGILYIDDIRVYTSRCFADRAKPRADFTNDCEVGMPDLKIMTDDWALSGYDFDVAAPSDANLELHYEFEGSLLDSSINARTASDPCGTLSYAAGKIGASAVNFNGTNYAVVTGYTGVTGTQDRTCSAWIKTSIDGELMIWGTNTDTLKWIWRIQHEQSGFVAGALRVEIASGSTVGVTDLRDGQWHHVAAVLSSDGAPMVSNIALYVDGMLEAPTSLDENSINTSTDTEVVIGKGPFNDRPFTGQMDDVRLYSRALSQGEVASLAGLAGTVTQPLYPLLTTTEDTDLVDDEVINFKDYAELLNMWLDELLWP